MDKFSSQSNEFYQNKATKGIKYNPFDFENKTKFPQYGLQTNEEFSTSRKSWLMECLNGTKQYSSMFIDNKTPKRYTV